MASPIPYSDDLETVEPDEAEHIQRCIDAMFHTNGRTFDTHRHGVRATHAKSHGILTGELTVHDGLAPELAQGAFATPGTHPVVIRIATETGQLDDDRSPAARGLSLKIFGVAGEMLDGDPDHHVQDFLFNTMPVLGPGTAKTFMEISEIRDRHFQDADAISEEISQRDDAEALSAFDRLTPIHPLANQFYTQGAFRHGDYVAKLAMFPGTPEQAALGERDLSQAERSGVMAQLLADWASSRETRFTLCVQLRTQAESMPVEDAAVDWPQSESPYVPVATVRCAPQDPYSPARRVFADDRLAFRPWHGLAAHRPLGSVNRLRRRAYEVLGEQRFSLNAVTGTEMTDPSELPD